MPKERDQVLEVALAFGGRLEQDQILRGDQLDRAPLQVYTLAALLDSLRVRIRDKGVKFWPTATINPLSPTERQVSRGKGGMYPAGSASHGRFQGTVVGMENRSPLEGSRKSHPARGGLMSRQVCGIVGAPRPSVMWFGHSTKSWAPAGFGAPSPQLRRALQPRWNPFLKPGRHREVTLPGLPQIRTCAIDASGSSA